jgi:hypothetical protein
MNKIKSLLKDPTKTFEDALSKKINWFKTLFFFSLNGIMFMHLIMKSGGYYDFNTKTTIFASIMTLITIGVFYGITSNIILGFLIKLTGKLFNANNNLKRIYNAIGIAYIPLYISLILLFINLGISGFLLSNEYNSGVILLAGLIIIFTLIQTAISIWQLILLYKGLKVAQNLDRTNTILNYLSGAIIYGVFHFLLIKPYLQ